MHTLRPLKIGHATLPSKRRFESGPDVHFAVFVEFLSAAPARSTGLPSSGARAAEIKARRGCADTGCGCVVSDQANPARLPPAGGHGRADVILAAGGFPLQGAGNARYAQGKKSPAMGGWGKSP